MSRQATDRRDFLAAMGAGSLATAGLFAGRARAGEGKEKGVIQGFDEVENKVDTQKSWQPVSDRKLRVGIVGYGVCKFGAAFSFQDHPNVDIVAVSDLIPERCKGLAKACRCEKTYPSLEELVKDPKIEAVFVATDAPSHARHCIEVLTHGKHVACAVPAVFGSLEQAEKLLEAVKASGLKYAMFETSVYRSDCYGMRQIYQAGGFGRLVYSEGEYFHYMPKPIPSFKGWRVGLPPQWYPTHSTAYYVGVTGKRLTSVSCVGFRGKEAAFQPGANKYDNRFTDELALFQTSEGGASRMAVAWGVQGYHGEVGRVFGELGSMGGTSYHGQAKKLPATSRPPLPPKVQPGGHSGSHGQLMNEFVTAILTDRQPIVDIYEALAMTVPGIIAHQSTQRDGETLKIPQYDPATS